MSLDLDVKWSDSHGTVHTWKPGDPGPRFFEETTYRLRAKSLVSGQVPFLAHRDPLLLRDVDVYEDDGMCAGPFSFRQQVGVSRLEVRVASESLWLQVEVFPTKLSYERDYGEMLHRVASVSRGLAIRFLRSTHRYGTAASAEHVSGVEWLTVLRDEIELLDKAVRHLDAHPHKGLSRRVANTPVEKLKRSDTSVRRAVIRQHGSGPFVQLPDGLPVRSAVPAPLAREVLDIPEHQWLRLNLQITRDRLEQFHGAVAAEIRDSERRSGTAAARLTSELAEIATLGGMLRQLLALPVFAGVDRYPPAGFSSLALLAAPGYAEAYRVLTSLRLGLQVEGDVLAMSVMDLDLLYEVWCFLEVLQFVASVCGSPGELGDLVAIEESGIRVRLGRGVRRSVRFPGRNRGLTLSYNPEFRGLTGNQRPDVVLRFQYADWPDLIVVLDAKYRLDASESYVAEFGTPGPPQDAINALHRYRDAILVESVERGHERPVVKGVALFPLPPDYSSAFRTSRLYKALSEVGVGALPFLPSNTDLVREWLSQLADLPPETLAQPGPPFAGLRELSRRGSPL